METHEFGDLKILVDRDSPGRLALSWTGRSNSRDPARLLDAFFRGVVKEAVDEGLCVEMRFERLDFFNSATITTLIQFVQEMSRNEARLVLVFDSTKRWQKLSFDVLRVFEKADGLLELRPMEA